MDAERRIIPIVEGDQGEGMMDPYEGLTFDERGEALRQHKIAKKKNKKRNKYHLCK